MYQMRIEYAFKVAALITHRTSIHSRLPSTALTNLSMKNITLGLAAATLAGIPYATLATTPPEFEIGGFMQVDGAFFEGAHNAQARGSEYEIRRARIGLKHESKTNWEAELEFDINDQDNEVGV